MQAFKLLKPNSITLAGLELDPNWFRTGSSCNLAYHLAC